MKKPEVVDLNESILRAAELATRHIRPDSIQLDLKLSGKSPRVLAHPAALSQALLSLVTNAIDTICSASPSGTIQITSAVIRDQVLVSVIDDGPAKKTDPRVRLRVPQDIIRKIGGDVWVSSGESCGTTYTIELPSAVN